MTGQHQQTYPDPTTMNDQDLKSTAMQVLNVFLSGQLRLQGQQDEAGNLTVYAVGVGSLDDIPEGVWEQLAAQGITFDKVQLSPQSVFGGAVLAEARSRYGDEFAAIEAAMKETFAAIKAASEEANAKIQAISEETNAKIEQIAAPVNALITAFIGPVATEEAPASEEGGETDGKAEGCCGKCGSGSCDGNCSGGCEGCGCKG